MKKLLMLSMLGAFICSTSLAVNSTVQEKTEFGFKVAPPGGPDTELQVITLQHDCDLTVTVSSEATVILPQNSSLAILSEETKKTVSYSKRCDDVGWRSDFTGSSLYLNNKSLQSLKINRMQHSK